jgi:phosphoglycolate phosphatase-like HAD superfamily hydrolase
MLIASTLNRYNSIFWDFDGVIKDSVPVKSYAFAQLFSTFGNELEQRILEHHESHGGISRFEKIPLYLEWAGEECSDSTVDLYCNRFSALVTQAVIDSPWVEGVQDLLLDHAEENTFFLLTATPQEEIEKILIALQIENCFKEVVGAPISKTDAMGDILSRYTIDIADAVMIGDSNSDYVAASKNGVDFILRKTTHNTNLQNTLGCQTMNEFTE